MHHAPHPPTCNTPPTSAPRLARPGAPSPGWLSRWSRTCPSSSSSWYVRVGHRQTPSQPGCSSQHLPSPTAVTCPLIAPHPIPPQATWELFSNPSRTHLQGTIFTTWEPFFKYPVPHPPASAGHHLPGLWPGADSDSGTGTVRDGAARRGAVWCSTAQGVAHLTGRVGATAASGPITNHACACGSWLAGLQTSPHTLPHLARRMFRQPSPHTLPSTPPPTPAHPHTRTRMCTTQSTC